LKSLILFAFADRIGLFSFWEKVSRKTSCHASLLEVQISFALNIVVEFVRVGNCNVK